jgi:nuclease S1
MRQLPHVSWLVAATALIFAPAISQANSALRWGPDGHRIVAEIALERLSATVADETRRLLGGQNITDVATWADEVRRQLPNTGPWHYIDIEITDSSYVPARDCKEDACVIAAVAAQTAILSDRTRSDSARAVALKFVVHFIGDLHQPLHAGERGDKGGNDVKVTFEGKLTNLHSIWDSGMLLSFGQTDADIVRQLTDEIGRRSDIAALSRGTVVSWVMESHDIARDVVYRNLPNSLVITQQYVDAARPVIYERLLRGGVRLAAVLERALGGPAK